MRIENLQPKTLPFSKVLELLIYFKEFRKIKGRALAEKLHYQETYLSQVLNGHKEPTEKLLHALESFFLLDNLNQVRQIDRDIEELKRRKAVLAEQTIEKFYAERAVTATNEATAAAARLEMNEAMIEASVAKNLDSVADKIRNGPDSGSAPAPQPSVSNPLPSGDAAPKTDHSRAPSRSKRTHSKK